MPPKKSSKKSSSSTRSNSTLVHRILAKTKTATTIIKDFETCNPIHIPSFYYIGKNRERNESGEKIEGHKCKYKGSRYVRNCVKYVIEKAVEDDDATALSLYSPSYDESILRCSNPYCRGGNGNELLPTGNTFHASCYAHMIFNDDTREHIIKFEYDPKSPLTITKAIVFPVCQPACWTTVNALQRNYYKNLPAPLKRSHNMREGVRLDDESLLPRWEDDWVFENGPTSMSVLVDWVSDENNASAYYGAADTNTGNTKGITKDGYHNMIAVYIRDKTGKYK